MERGVQVTALKRDEVVASALELEGTERHINVVRGDVCDALLIERVLNEYEVESVFHLAAQTLVGVANRSPVSTYETNIRGTWTVLDARRRSVRRVVVAASDKAYGAQNNLPYTEASPLLPLFPYDVSKAATDMIARSYWHTFGLPVAVTRSRTSTAGATSTSSRLVPECVLAAIDGRPPLIRSDGTPQRDFLYVDDAVETYLAIWSLLDQGRAAGEAFNAGGGRPARSVRSLSSCAGRPAPASRRMCEGRRPQRRKSSASGCARRNCAKRPTGRRGWDWRKGWLEPSGGTASTSNPLGSSDVASCRTR